MVHVIEEAGKQSLWVRQVATANNVQIVAPAEMQYFGMTFSSDGNYIYYVVTRKNTSLGVLYQVPVLGGTPAKTGRGCRCAHRAFARRERDCLRTLCAVEGVEQFDGGQSGWLR